jgi:hypothetical protein
LTPIGQFIYGLYDGLRIGKAIETIFQHGKVRRITFMCVLVNGCLYLGEEVLYMVFTRYFFGKDTCDDPHESEWQLSRILVFLLATGTDIAQFMWSALIYLVTLILTTIWVQEIFDYLMDTKIKQLEQKAASGDKDVKALLKQLELI